MCRCTTAIPETRVRISCNEKLQRKLDVWLIYVWELLNWNLLKAWIKSGQSRRYIHKTRFFVMIITVWTPNSSYLSEFNARIIRHLISLMSFIDIVHMNSWNRKMARVKRKLAELPKAYRWWYCHRRQLWSSKNHHCHCPYIDYWCRSLPERCYCHSHQEYCCSDRSRWDRMSAEWWYSF